MSDPPHFLPSARELDDLELMGRGALVPLTGFQGPGCPITLTVTNAVARDALRVGALELVDPEGVPLARVDVEATYVARDGIGIAGSVTLISRNESGPFRKLAVTTREVSERYGSHALTVPVSRPLTVEDLERINKVANGNSVVLLALVGTGMPEDISPHGLIRATLAAAALLPDAHVVTVPLAARAEPELDHNLTERVAAAYAPGEILRVAGKGGMPAKVAQVVATDRPSPLKRGLVVLFTGLSGSGKSTLARALHDVILERGERTVTSLDGDVVRRNLCAGLSFSKEDRDTNVTRIGWVAAEISRHGGVAICSPIAPYRASRRKIQEMVEAAGGVFVLVHVATPLEECERRDRKGLYGRARMGEILDFTGISSPYEEPEDAALRVDTTGRSVPSVLEEVLVVLYSQGWFEPRSDAHA
jgi:sulfate adenylyltransferase